MNCRAVCLIRRGDESWYAVKNASEFVLDLEGLVIGLIVSGSPLRELSDLLSLMIDAPLNLLHSVSFQAFKY